MSEGNPDDIAAFSCNWYNVRVLVHLASRSNEHSNIAPFEQHHCSSSLAGLHKSSSYCHFESIPIKRSQSSCSFKNAIWVHISNLIGLQELRELWRSSNLDKFWWLFSDSNIRTIQFRFRHVPIPMAILNLLKWAIGIANCNKLQLKLIPGQVCFSLVELLEQSWNGCWKTVKRSWVIPN